MRMGDILLNVAGVLTCSYVNGPGKRFVLWVQGCTIGCKGCFNKELQPYSKKYIVEPIHFAQEISQIAIRNGCEGFTISGGEPFQQSKAVNILIKQLKNNKFTIICFTGYTYDKLRKSRNQDIQDILNNIDVLIAGPYNQANHHKLVWFDNADKKIIFLTNAYSKSDFVEVASCEYILDMEGIIYSGFRDVGENESIIANILPETIK